MIRTLLSVIALLLAFAGAANAQGALVLSVCEPSTLYKATDGMQQLTMNLKGQLCGQSELTFGGVPVDSTHPLPVQGSAAGTPINDNLAQVGGVTVSLGQKAGASSIPVVPPSDPDIRPVAGSITVVDTGSTSTNGFNSIAQVTGTPTAGSFYTQAINGQSSALLQVTGTWTGTLSFEGSIDGGTTWIATTMRQRGSSFTTTTTTGNGLFETDSTGTTNFRVRATAAMTGTAVPLATFSQTSGPIQVLNPLRWFDNVTNNQASILANGAVSTGLGNALTNPISSPYARMANTTAYTGSSATPQLVANSTTAGSVVVPTFTVTNSGKNSAWPRARLYTNKTSGMGGVTMVITLFTAAGTYTNGDGGTYALATGNSNIIAQYTCTFIQNGDGAWCPSVPNTGTAPTDKPASGATIAWDMQTQSGWTPASGQTFTLKMDEWD